MNNVKTNPGRQELVVAVQEIDVSNVDEAGTVTLFSIPAKSVIVGGHAVVETASDATTATISLGVEGATTKYLSAVDMKTEAETEVTTDGVAFDEITDVIATIAMTGTPTVGNTRVALQYYMVDRAGFSHGVLKQTP